MSETSPRLNLSILANALDPDPHRVAPLARQLGVTGLLFDAHAPSLSFPDLSQTGRRELRHVLSSERLQLVGLRADLGSKGFGPGADVDRLLHRLDRAMDAAAGLQAPLLCVDLGPLPTPPRIEKPKPAVTPEQAGLLILPTTIAAPVVEPPPAPPNPADAALTAQVNAALSELCARADRYSVTVALSTSLASFAALEQVLTTARCPWFGVDLDPVALLGDEWPADEVFSRLGPLLRHVRIRDATVGADRRTRPSPVGQGSTDWNALLTRLDDSGYRSWLTIDPTEMQDRYAAAQSAIARLRSAMSF